MLEHSHEPGATLQPKSTWPTLRIHQPISDYTVNRHRIEKQMDRELSLTLKSFVDCCKRLVIVPEHHESVFPESAWFGVTYDRLVMPVSRRS